MTLFRQKVFEVVKSIPRGSVVTYREVAKRAGSPRAFRAFGSILKTNFDLSVPCPRVIRSDGKLGNFNRGSTRKKREILLKEKAFAI